ncbi:UNVERIFIED_CONTAM: hypothetical protein Sradi_3285600 [Sesamum radiatum]|uniref:Uncharacterized protein n=1 Tax=Sesamum radiatum TaxID=300843 RepID=A0AAW2R1I1_SESRA
MEPIVLAGRQQSRRPAATRREKSSRMRSPPPAGCLSSKSYLLRFGSEYALTTPKSSSPEEEE